MRGPEAAAYRIAVPAIVAVSGRDVRAGFVVIELIAVGVSALVLLALLRRGGATPGTALRGARWWLAPPFGLRRTSVCDDGTRAPRGNRACRGRRIRHRLRHRAPDNTLKLRGPE